MSAQTATPVSEHALCPTPPKPAQETPVAATVPIDTYPCTFPRCRNRRLTSGQLYVPTFAWVHKQLRPDQLFSEDDLPTLEEMAWFGRCHFHAFKAVPGLEFNRRKNIMCLTPLDVPVAILRHQERKAAQRDAARAAYRIKHAQEKEAKRLEHREQKQNRVYPTAAPSFPEKRYGDERRLANVPEPSTKKGDKKKGGKQQKQQGRRHK